MVKLDVSVLKYLTKEDFRVLTSVEMGMKNHEIVSTELIAQIAKVKKGGCKRALTNLHRNKLLWHDGSKYDGFRLTFSGYDFLALRALSKRETVHSVGRKIGVGKESDIYLCADANLNERVLKLHRLGKTSFRTVKNNRDYLLHRQSASWLYYSRLSAIREFAYMKVLHTNGFPVPTPYDVSRHAVVMEWIKGAPLCQVREIKHVGRVYSDLMELLARLARCGLIHGDFNEFNIIIGQDETITLIDFPQMVSVHHKNAEMYFQRDVSCIKQFFLRRFGFEGGDAPTLQDCLSQREADLDVEVKASGFLNKEEAEWDYLAHEDSLGAPGGKYSIRHQVDDDIDVLSLDSGSERDEAMDASDSNAEAEDMRKLDFVAGAMEDGLKFEDDADACLPVEEEEKRLSERLSEVGQAGMHERGRRLSEMLKSEAERETAAGDGSVLNVSQEEMRRTIQEVIQQERQRNLEQQG
eukprot:CAMPEP_0177638804 /NCGR_PEP_ID=MMETSP0447-20121125/5687_1 /TAXON_ID=0 /ORGANISM="Stygamoeba regulata, Strain BSH-02190019" /LENGTH=466 /DNA_ID=CAMNT_0019140797 /DNA_START=143 /DNA_END=1540 /DNA_ORIENTATION=+